MLSIKSININSYNIGNTLENSGVDKQYYGDIQSSVIGLPDFNMYTVNDDLIFDEQYDNIVSALEGRAMTNRLKIDDWHMFTNGDVLTIEHQLANSRVQQNEIELSYNDDYMTDILFNPSERVNIRLTELIIDCVTFENALFAEQTLVVHNAKSHVCNVSNEGILSIAACYDEMLLYTPKRLCSVHFLNRSVNMLKSKFIDVSGYALPNTVNITPTRDVVIDVSSDDANNLFMYGEMQPVLTLTYETRYIFKGKGIHLLLLSNADERFLTEKGFVDREQFYREPSKSKFIIIHPEQNTFYSHRITGRGNDIVVIS